MPTSVTKYVCGAIFIAETVGSYSFQFGTDWSNRKQASNTSSEIVEYSASQSRNSERIDLPKIDNVMPVMTPMTAGRFSEMILGSSRYLPGRSTTTTAILIISVPISAVRMADLQLMLNIGL